MNSRIRSLAALLAPLLALSVSCASRPEQPAEYVPPRLDLARYESLGVAEFAGNAKLGLGASATEQFIAAIHAAQPGTPLLELGAIAGAGNNKLAAETIREIAARERVGAVFVGEISESKSKPRVAIDPSFATGRVASERKARISVRLLDGVSGATVWSASSERTIPVVGMNGAFGELPSVRTTPADEARAILVRDLVEDVTFDFRPQWVRR
jgi:hypothetical protein